MATEIKCNKIRIRISPSNYSGEPLNSKKYFWNYINVQTRKHLEYPEKLEFTFKQNFPIELKSLLINKFQSRLDELEDNYYLGALGNNYRHLYHRLLDQLEEKNEFQFREFFAQIGKLQELKNTYLKDNVEYQSLLNKIHLANQIEFQITDITYASLGFSLLISSLETAKSLFDNNFELLETFLNPFIPTAFLSSLSLPIEVIEDFELDVSIDFPDAFKKEFATKKRKSFTELLRSSDKDKQRPGWYKAKWLWTISNFSLIPSVLLVIIVCYYSFDKFETLNKIRQDNYHELSKDNELIFKSYQDLIKLQQDTYSKMIHDIKKDSAK